MQSMLDARVIKNQDEIMLLNQAAAMVDGVYQDIVEALKPGVRENEIVALDTADADLVLVFAGVRRSRIAERVEGLGDHARDVPARVDDRIEAPAA